MNLRKKIYCLLYKIKILNFLPDKQFILFKYWSFFGKLLNLKEPQTFNEKLQWLKIYDHKPEYINLVDKYEVKKFVSNIIGEEYIIPSLGVWENFDEINFKELPSKFILKCTHDSGGLVFVRDKMRLDIKKARNKINSSLRRNYYWNWREWPYKGVHPRIIAEEFLDDGRNPKDGLTDYKFFCFNGKPQFLYISSGLEDHSTASISFYDFEGQKLPFKREDYKSFPGDNYNLPVNFSTMYEIAEKLAFAIPCPFIRVDLYNVNGKIYFSEITFSPCGGAIPFEPEEADREIGQLLKLN